MDIVDRLAQGGDDTMVGQESDFGPKCSAFVPLPMVITRLITSRVSLHWSGLEWSGVVIVIDICMYS